MAHYAFLDENNNVTEVIVGRNEDEVVEGITDWEAYYGNIRGQVCKRTSYNTYAGKSNREGGVPFRKNYAGTGFIYDPVRDAFYRPQPFASFILNEDTCIWEAPVPYPTDGNKYSWDEPSKTWQQIGSAGIPGSVV
jgi:hypothetical protein